MPASESSSSPAQAERGVRGPPTRARAWTEAAWTRLARHRARLRRHAAAATLGGILLLGLGLRVQASHWGLPYLSHWDEPFVANRALEILRTGDYGPHFFNYGSLVLYLDAAVDVLHYYQLVRLPEADPRHLRSPRDIRFHGAREDPLDSAPEREPYWVSHPSFYLWNRYLTACFGAAAIALCCHLAGRLFGATAGLVAAFAIAVSSFHIEQSAFVTTDVPAATLALGALAGTLAFARDRAPRALLAGCFVLGLAAGTKYNAALFGLVPLAVLAVVALRGGPDRRPWLWAAASAAVALGFLIATPYALLDLPTFLEHTGRMLSGYLARQETMLQVAPGWPHLARDLSDFAANWGTATTIGIAAGLVVALRRPLAWVVLPIGLLVLFATSRTTAPFHRNLVVCYPLAAIALGALAQALRDGERWRPARQLAGVGLGLALLGSAWSGVVRARLLAGTADTRSLVIDRLNETSAPAGDRVAFARELGIHDLDLARLRHPYSIAPLRDLVCAPTAARVIVAPTRPTANFESRRAEARELALLVAALGAPRGAIDPQNGLTLDTPFRSPGLGLFVPRTPFVAPLACGRAGVEFDSLRPQGPVGRAVGSLELAPGASVETAPFLAPPGHALLSARLAASQGTALVRAALVVTDAASGRELERFPLTLHRQRKNHESDFEVTAPTPIRIRLEVAPASPGAALLYGLWLAPAGVS